jgi:hypothetical protein
MTDDKKIKDEELANITGAGPDLGDKKTPSGGGGAADDKVDTTGDNQEPGSWSAG